jgi:hypothetical protein
MVVMDQEGAAEAALDERNDRQYDQDRGNFLAAHWFFV